MKDDVPVGEQGLHGADVLLVVSAVEEAKRNRVRNAVRRLETSVDEGEGWQL